jgi:tetratricopeptide (TPR) repeat protein
MRAPVLTEIKVSGSALLAHAPAAVPDVFAGAPLRLALKLRPEGGDLRVSGRTLAGGREGQLVMPAVGAGEGSAGVVSLYGREAVEDLEVRRAAGAETVDRDIERIGIEFQIATRLTSWVAVSEEPAVDPTQPARRVRIPHALPDGLSLEGLGLRRGLHAMPMMAAIDLAMAGTADLLAATGFAPPRAPMRMMERLLGSRGPRLAATLRARLVLRKRRDLTLEIEIEVPFDWAPGKSTVRWSDGTTVHAEVVTEATTAPGPVTPGLTVRLTLRLVADGPTAHRWEKKTYYTQVRLQSLPPESASELLHALLGDAAGLEPLKRMLRRRGNPLFLEETVRTLVETKVLEGQRGAYRLARPVQSLQIPATVQAILAARIDRLPVEDKQVLQTASVIGKDVPSTILTAIAGLPDEALRRTLDHLQDAEFLYETTMFPGIEYTFKHSLTHEVTYGSLLQERRRTLHGQIVETIERLYADRLTEHVERLARHALRGELWERAVTYLCQAGRKAAARSALHDARVWFEDALGALEMLSESPSRLEQAFEIRLELRPVLTLLGEIRQVLARLREAEALAERLNDDRRRGRVCAFVTNVNSLIGELDRALVFGNRALAIAQTRGDLELRITTTNYLEHAHYLRGEYERVVELATANLAALPAGRVGRRSLMLEPQPQAAGEVSSCSVAYDGRSFQRTGLYTRLSPPDPPTTALSSVSPLSLLSTLRACSQSA